MINEKSGVLIPVILCGGVGSTRGAKAAVTVRNAAIGSGHSRLGKTVVLLGWSVKAVTPPPFPVLGWLNAELWFDLGFS